MIVEVCKNNKTTDVTLKGVRTLLRTTRPGERELIGLPSQIHICQFGYV